MAKLPRAPAYKHIAAFKRAGWVVDHVEGSHYILVKGKPESTFRSPCTRARISPLVCLEG